MQQNIIICAVALIAPALWIGCSSDDGDGNEDTASMEGPRLTEGSTATQALLAQTEDYRTWARVDDGERIRSEGHSDMFVATFYNDVIQTAAADGVMPLPDGSIFVKEAYMSMDAPSPMALTVMSKTAGEWYWVQATPDERVFVDDSGTPLEGTDVAMCLGCHQGVASNDFVFSDLTD